MKKLIGVNIFLILLLSNQAFSSSAFSKITDDYFDGYFEHNPTSGTSAGFHQYDDKLEDYSKSEVANQIKFFHQWLEKLTKVDVTTLSKDEKTDRELIMSNVNANLLELENVKSWEKNPDHYSSGLSSSIFTLMSRTFASEDKRLRSVIARENQSGKVFAAARQNLKNPPQIYTEIALEQIPGIIDFFKNDVPKAFGDVKDEALLKEFNKSNDAVVEDLRIYGNYLKNEVIPISHGDFRLGKENYEKKLLYDEMVDIQLYRLL